MNAAQILWSPRLKQYRKDLVAERWEMFAFLWNMNIFILSGAINFGRIQYWEIEETDRARRKGAEPMNAEVCICFRICPKKIFEGFVEGNRARLLV